MRQISVLACLSVLLAVLGCDSVADVASGKSCFLGQEKINVVADALGDEWSVSGQEAALFGEPVGEVCVVSKDARPYLGSSATYFVSENGEPLTVNSFSQSHWVITWAEWAESPTPADERLQELFEALE